MKTKMKIKSLLLISLLLLSSHALAEDGDIQEEQALSLPSAAVASEPGQREPAQINDELLKKLFSAQDELVKAKNAEAADERSKFYAEAIKQVNLALQEEPDNYVSQLLAAQIYRSKGGASYAKSYYLEAEKIIQDKLHENPDDIKINTEYAILNYACDVRYWNDRDKYAGIAAEYAEKVLALCEKLPEKEKDSPLNLKCAAYAKLILGDVDACEELLRQRTGKTYAELEGVHFDDEGISAVDMDYALFKMHLLDNVWFWEVKPENLAKEYFQYYLFEFYYD